MSVGGVCEVDGVECVMCVYKACHIRCVSSIYVCEAYGVCVCIYACV